MKTGIDSHCHLEHIENPGKVAEEIRKRMLAAVTSCPDPKDFKLALDLRKKFPDCVFACLGFHPEHIDAYAEKEIERAMEFISGRKNEVSGIGECGLDYSWVKSGEKREKTKEVFARFIGLANELGLPVVVHARNEPGGAKDAFDDCLKILTDNNAKRVVMHCFSGNEQQLKYALEQSYWISFATIICRSDKHRRLAGKTPLDRMLLETDSPWLDPDSRELTNRPWKIERSADTIAGIKETTKEEILAATAENAKRAFGLASISKEPL